MCVCRVKYPACNVLVCACGTLSSVVCSPLQYFSTLSYKRHDFQKCYWRQNVCFDFLYNLSGIFLILSISERDIIKMYISPHVMYPFSCQTWLKLGFSRKIFEKYSNIKFQENPSGGSRVVSCGRKDGQRDNRQKDRLDETNSLVSQVCERA
jgi:hypothetical protein